MVNHYDKPYRLQDIPVKNRQTLWGNEVFESALLEQLTRQETLRRGCELTLGSRAEAGGRWGTTTWPPGRAQTARQASTAGCHTLGTTRHSKGQYTYTHLLLSKWHTAVLQYILARDLSILYWEKNYHTNFTQYLLILEQTKKTKKKTGPSHRAKQLEAYAQICEWAYILLVQNDVDSNRVECHLGNNKCRTFPVT